MASSTARISVVLGDDDARVRTAVVALLAEEPDFVVAAQAADGDQAVTAAGETAARLVLVDVRMPTGGPDLVRRLVGLPHRPVVVALSAQTDATTWRRMLAAGCCAYLVKGAIAADLPGLLRRCERGELVVAVPGAADVVRRALR